MSAKKKSTSWGAVAKWYEQHLSGDDTYHAKVVAPNLIRMLGPEPGMQVVDIGCGEGYFTRIISASGAHTIGADISPELIALAKKHNPEIEYHVAAADSLRFSQSASVDAITCVLALQNMERIEPVFKECARILAPGGRMVFVLNHPAFRIPQRSSWGWDDSTKVQYRRIDAYLSAAKNKIDMTPGAKGEHEYTYSFHRSLQDYTKALSGAGFGISRIEEWISHRASEKGPRQAAEDTARKEFPLFLAVEIRKF